MKSELYHSPFCCARLWTSKGSARSTACLGSDPGSDDEAIGLSATMEKKTQVMHNSLSFSDRCVSPDSYEKSKVCWLIRHLHHQQTRIKMFIKRVAEKGGLGTRKEILVTTRIEVVSTPAPSPTISSLTSQHVTFPHHFTVTSLDIISDGGPASPRSVSRLMMSPSYCSVDAQPGAGRSNMRRHSLPFTSSLPFTKLTNVASRPRASSHNDGNTSVLGMEAEWTQCLERPTMRSSISCGTVESNKDKKTGISDVDVKRRMPWKIGGRHLGRLGIGKRMGRMGKVN